jgi:hypothetical protein
MELSWLMRFRIAASVATGAILIGIWAWPLAAPIDPFQPVSLLAGTITLGDAITLGVLALLAGLIAYFLSWPYGREIGILAVPAGLALWAVRSGNMASLMQSNPTLAQRQAIFAALRWEPIFWLAIVAAGFAGVWLGWRILQPQATAAETQEKANSKPNIYLNAAFALAGSVLIAQFCIRIFAQDVKIFDNKLGSVVAQPPIGQIVFAVLVSFGLTGFLVKKFLNASYIWPTIASALLTAFVSITYIKQDVLEYLTQRWPAVFFSNAVACILPLQIVAFGTLGSIAGYWLAVRYNYWRKHEIN